VPFVIGSGQWVPVFVTEFKHEVHVHCPSATVILKRGSLLVEEDRKPSADCVGRACGQTEGEDRRATASAEGYLGASSKIEATHIKKYTFETGETRRCSCCASRRFV